MADNTDDISKTPDAELVTQAGSQSQTGHQAEIVKGHRAAAELSRRLSVRIAELTATVERSGNRLEILTKWLIALTIILGIVGVIQIVVTLNR